MDNFVSFHDDAEYMKFGIVEYSKPLSNEDANHFSLAPLFLDGYNGKTVNFFENLIGTITLRNNNMGQLFFEIGCEDEDYKKTEVWYSFLGKIEDGTYKIIK